MQKLYKINIEGEEYHVGYPASVLVGQLEEELETLRAENAKLIAERDRLNKYSEIPEDTIHRLLIGRATSGDQLLAANALQQLEVYQDVYCGIADIIEPYVLRDGINPEGELPASVSDSVRILFNFWLEHKEEREAMMKQEPVGVDCGEGKTYMKSDFSDVDGFLRACRNNTPLYASPLPAQQIPEGYALVPIEPTDAMVEMGARNIFSYATIDRSAKEVYKAMLSASQPKGE